MMPPLDLNDKDDWKLFQEGCKGLLEKDMFTGSKTEYGNWVKLIETDFESTRTMEALGICTTWNTTGGTAASNRVPTEHGNIDIFTSNKASKEDVIQHCELVWSDSTFGSDTPKYFKNFVKVPTDDATLNDARNLEKLKHIMMGTKIWNSLSSSFKIEISGSKKEFKKNQEYVGPLLWDFIRRRINPTTTVGASILKDELESKTASDFGHNIIKYNTWFDDTREAIIKEDGKDSYNEYLRSMFRAYLLCGDKEFNEAIKDEKRRWTQGKLGPNYTHRDLMDLGRLTYNNLVSDKSWMTGCSGKAKMEQGDAEKNYLALATELMKKMSDYKQPAGAQRERATEGERTYKAWRFENPDGLKTKMIRQNKMTWCSNDCHEQPMWCGRKNCMNRSDYSEAWKKKKGGGNEGSKAQPSNGSSEFKIALAAITSPADFAALQEQFGELKD